MIVDASIAATWEDPEGERDPIEARIWFTAAGEFGRTRRYYHANDPDGCDYDIEFSSVAILDNRGRETNKPPSDELVAWAIKELADRREAAIDAAWEGAGPDPDRAYDEMRERRSER